MARQCGGVREDGQRCSTCLDGNSRLAVLFETHEPADQELGFDERDQFASADPRDHSGRDRPADGTDFAAACDEGSLNGLRIAVRPMFFIPCVS